MTSITNSKTQAGRLFCKLMSDIISTENGMMKYCSCARSEKSFQAAGVYCKLCGGIFSNFLIRDLLPSTDFTAMFCPQVDF